MIVINGEEENILLRKPVQIHVQVLTVKILSSSIFFLLFFSPAAQ